MDTRIARLSGWLWWKSAALAYLLPVVICLAILQGWFDPAALVARFSALSAGTEVNTTQAALVAAAGLFSVYPMVAAIPARQGLCGRYRRDELLTEACAAENLRMGRALVAVALMTVILPTVQLLILSWNTGPGHRVLSLSLDGSTLSFLLSAGLLLTIGWVMREAARAGQENAEFV
ncbi:MAG: hypothetical protein NTX73_18065 [Rhodobacterales bacterium]|nr:hypothetical protein [Rhodobacterales bacterium]